MSVTYLPLPATAREVVTQASLALEQVGVDTVAPSELGDLLSEIARLRNQLDALDVAAIHKARVCQEWESDGSRSLNAWVQRKSLCTKALAGRKISASKVLACTPALAEVFCTGETSLEHVAVVAAAIQPGAREEHVGEVDRILAELAVQTGPAQLRKAVVAWAGRVDDIALGNEYADAADHAYLHVSPLLNGMVRVDGMLDPETGQVLIDALKATREQLQPHPDDGGLAVDRKPVSQQNAHALHHLLAVALATGQVANGPAGLPVTLFVTTSVDTLNEQLDGIGVIPPELVGHGPLPAATARRLACDAQIIPAVLDGQSRILDLGTTKRTIPTYLRAAVTARDHHCRFGDCQHPIEEIHHVKFWSHGGPTSLQNLAGLCRAHHHAVHERGWTLAGDANAELTIGRR